MYVHNRWRHLCTCMQECKAHVCMSKYEYFIDIQVAAYFQCSLFICVDVTYVLMEEEETYTSV